MLDKNFGGIIILILMGLLMLGIVYFSYEESKSQAQVNKINCYNDLTQQATEGEQK